MASYLTLLEQLSTAVDQLNQVLQGDENTTVTINGVEQPSVQKKTLDEITAKVQLVLDAAADIDSVKYASIGDGLSATASGQFFSVVSNENNRYLDLYANESGEAVFKKSYPSGNYINELNVKINNTRSEIGEGGLALYNGDDLIIPIVSDLLFNVLLGYDKTEKSIIGKGIGDDYSRKYSQAKYDGAEHYPLLVDSSGKVLIGYDVKNDEIIGAGLSDKFSKINNSLDSIDISGSYKFTEKEALPIKPINKAINQIISYGQSNSIGAKGEPVISTSQPYSNLTFSGGPRAYDGGNYSFTPLRSLVENAGNSPDGRTDRGETICSALANYTTTLNALDGLIPSDRVLLASAAGKGGSDIVNLKKTSGWYNNVFLRHIQEAHTFNLDHNVDIVTWVHGETDVDESTPYDSYKFDLSQLVQDFQTDAAQITGQTTPVFVLITQLSYGTLNTDSISRSQIEVAEENENIFISTPTYHLPHYTDETHLTNIGNKILGAYFAKSYKDILDGYKPKHLKPISATSRGNVVNVKLDVPVLPLNLDTDILKPTEDYGFYIEDSSGKVQLSKFEIENDILSISLERNLIGSSTIRYGYDYSAPGLGIKNSGSGNLRDSDPRKITILNEEHQLFNVCTHFEINIINLGE